jgi:tRNA threonylcarbamoyladenosine biosynthesis protein TsaB
MTILALEFSSARRSVAVAKAGVICAESVAEGGRATHAFALIEQALTAAQVPREEIGVLAVGLGPGSYTGIRAAIAIAQGWELARKIKVLGISSVEAIAVQAQAEKRFGQMQIVVDAQRGEFYLATWDISAAQRRENSPLKIVSAAQIEQRRKNGEWMAGPEESNPNHRWFPRAAAVAKLAGERSDFIAGELLTPIYLRETNFVKAPPPRTGATP